MPVRDQRETPEFERFKKLTKKLVTVRKDDVKKAEEKAKLRKREKGKLKPSFS